jgi:uncharacterized protein YcgI (DUF1989 family)
MTDLDLFQVPARCGKAQQLVQGQRIEIINTHGTQVVDTWAFNANDLDEWMSMEHTRATVDKMMPDLGEAFLTNKRRPIVTIVEDTSPGVHDTLNAACDIYRYQLLGCAEYHDNCTDNLKAALAALGLVSPRVPCPFNMFQNRPWEMGNQLFKKPPMSKPGDALTFRAEMDCIVVMSSCPQDINLTNGSDRMPKDVHYRVT